MNCNHPIVTRFLVDSLLYWVRRMHVDGFRFDLASALARGEDGNPQYHAPMLWATELSPTLNRPTSSPRPGTRPGSIRSATSRAFAGPSGTAATAT